MKMIIKGLVNDSPELVPRSWNVEGKIPRGDKQEIESELEFLQFSQIGFFPFWTGRWNSSIEKRHFPKFLDKRLFSTIEAPTIVET